MLKEKWAQVTRIYDGALALSGNERDHFITTQSKDPEIEQAVLRLLRTADLQTGFMATGGGIDESLITLAPGSRLGSWVIASNIGAGGMGEVYLAERADGHFDKQAALKLISSSSPEVWKRFSTERQILADLEHPGIARLIDGGVADDGRPFLVMEHITGYTLRKYADEKKLDILEKINLMLALCGAVSHAHERLILHRDIKPENVMVTEAGDLKLIDFGIAGLLAAEANDTRAPMTLAYAAPEQLCSKEVTMRTDVFGLGMTLHEILTGEIPKRDGLSVHVSAVINDNELRLILQKALAEDPQNRYRSVENFQLDLERFLSDHPVSAKPASFTYQTAKFIKRNRLGVALSGAFITALVAGIVGTSFMTVQARQAANERELARQIAEDRASFALINSSTFAALTGQAIAASENGSVDFRELIRTETQDAVSKLASEPIRSRARLHAISKIHDRRGDVDAVLKTVTPVFEGVDIDSRANVMNLIIFGVYTGWQGKKDKAFEAFNRAKAIMAKNSELYGFDLAMVEAFEAEFSAEPAQMQVAIEKLIAAGDATPLTSDGTRNEAVSLFRQAGYLYNRQNKPALALPLIRRAYDINLTIDGARDLPNEALLYPLVSLYAASGDIESAQQMSAAVVSQAEKTYGPSVPLAQRIKRQADLLVRLGKTEKVMPLYLRAADLFDQYDAKPSEQYLEVQLDIALLNAKNGQPDIALAALNQIFTDNLGFIDNNVNAGLLLYKQRGDIFAALGHPEAARESYEKSLSFARTPGARPDRLAAAQEAINNLGSGNSD